MNLYDTVEGHLEMNFYLKLNKYSMDEIDNLEPWMREIYINMCIRHQKERKEEMDNITK
jgi:hypothetical protein